MVKDIEPPPTFADKDACRAWGRQRRRLRPGSSVSDPVVAVLRSWLEARPPTTVLLYAAFGDEIDIGGLASPAVSGLGSDHLLATTRTPAEGPLTIHPWGSPTETHRYGFLQPTANAERIDPDRIGVVVVPGLVFDRSGRRLGYGRGYYDELLTEVRPEAAVGVVPSWMLVDRVPTEPHDVGMTHLATEAGVRAVTS